MAETAIQKQERNEITRPERTYAEQHYVPNVDIVERPDELLLLVDLPGVTNEDIDINYERGELTLAARVKPRQAPDTRYLLREYGVGPFVRSFQVGEGIDAAKINAELADGVLTLHLPKAEEARPRKIQVKAAN